MSRGGAFKVLHPSLQCYNQLYVCVIMKCAIMRIWPYTVIAKVEPGSNTYRILSTPDWILFLKFLLFLSTLNCINSVTQSNQHSPRPCEEGIPPTCPCLECRPQSFWGWPLEALYWGAGIVPEAGLTEPIQCHINDETTSGIPNRSLGWKWIMPKRCQ